MDEKEHWEHVFQTKLAEAVSWFQEHAACSLELIGSTDLGNDARIIDVGGGASTLVIRNAELPAQAFDIWHDRAVFHFLTDPDDRAAYVRQVKTSVRPGGHVIVATFAADGPETCSGLPVQRYSPDELHDEFGTDFELVDHTDEAHTTPWGAIQHFIYCHCIVRRAAA